MESDRPIGAYISKEDGKIHTVGRTSINPTKASPTDYGVGDIDGRGSMCYMAARERTDTKKAQEIKGWNGRGPITYPWKLLIGAALVYYFFVKK
jgi:hypothetical protein